MITSDPIYLAICTNIIGINIPSGGVTVQGSRITVTNADCGISGGNEIDNFLIQGSVLDFTDEGVFSVELLNGRDIQIDSSLTLDVFFDQIHMPQ